MTTINSGAYISNGELMAWVAEKTGGMYEDMADHMDIANERTRMVDDLNQLKSQVAESNNKEKHREVVENIDAILETYEDSPLYDELKELLEPMRAEFQYAGTTPANGPPITIIKQGDRDRFSDSIKSKIENFGKQDSLTLIRIQDVNSRIAQAHQLASNLMQSAHKAADSVVGNIRG